MKIKSDAAKRGVRNETYNNEIAMLLKRKAG
jgi:hypothetical protein